MLVEEKTVFYKAIGTEVEVFHHEVEVFHHASTLNLPLLLKGPTGSGKSRFVEYMANEVDKKLITVSCHEETSATDLIGRFIIKGAETIWIDGPLTIAVRNGYILYLDEVAEARPDVIVAIHSLTDHRRELFIDKLGETIKAHPDFQMIASFNPGYQKGYKELKPSTRQRFVALQFDYPQAKIEAEILMQESGIEKETAQKLVAIGTKIRSGHWHQNKKPHRVGACRNSINQAVGRCSKTHSKWFGQTPCSACGHSATIN